MNYRHVYMLIIEHAKSEMKNGLRPKSFYYRRNFQEQYFEFHHILPKSIYPNWAKRKSNLVALTAREHFFCHQLLTKIYPTPEMYFALSKFMSNSSGGRILTSTEYDKCRMAVSLGNKLMWQNQKFRKFQEEIRKRNPMFLSGTLEDKYGLEKATVIKQKLKDRHQCHEPTFIRNRTNEEKRRIQSSMKNRKMVKCIELNKAFMSIRDAARYINFDNKRLSRYIKLGLPVIKRTGVFKDKKLYFVFI